MRAQLYDRFMQAFAKLNLSLAVGPAIESGPKKGFHPIASLIAAIDLADEVEAVPGARGLEVAWAGDAPRATPIDWTSEQDLAMRALSALQEGVGRSLDVGLRVRKRIPVGGGLGGGSSDAAAALRAVNDACGLGLSSTELRAIGATLGSDVPFFVDDADPPRPAIVTGLGEAIERVTIPCASELSPVLIVPAFGCATGEVYRAFDRAPTRGVDEARVRRADPEDLFNDLQMAAELVRPELAAIRARAGAACDQQIHLTGSGSCLFVLVSRDEASGIAGKLSASLPACVVRAARFAESSACSKE
jgi:4-diphosphocytidyl-2-C-methyl-D-erythritol kinase